MINMLGRYNSESKKYEPENSFLEIWQREYDGITENADGFLQTAQDAFDTMVDQTSGDIKQPLNQGKGKINELRDSFDDIRAQIAEPIIQYSETIDKYGKLGSKLVFGVLALMNIALAIFILLLCFCSGKMCTNCCCCRCFFKFFIHLLWNILALLMIITFLVGFLFSLVGSVGYDAMSLISFVVSKDNLNSTNPVLVDKLGDAKKYLDKCINGDGKLEDVMDLNMGDINSFEKVNRVQGQINDAKITFENVTNNAFGYQMIESHLDERANMKFDYLALIKNSEQLSIDYKGVDIDNPDKQKYLIFQSYLEILNTAANSQGKSESWERNNENGKSCGVGDQPTGENLIFDPLTCKPLDRGWISTSTNNDIKWSAQILTDTIKFLEYAKDETKEKSLIKVFKDLRDNYYKPYLKKYSDALDAFGEMIDKIVGKLNEFTDQENGGVFGFINGKFIGTNLQIILKYLKSALGSDIKTIGICLLIVGCSLALSISATILLIVVINVDIDNNRQNSQVAEFGMASGGRVIQYQ